MLPLFKKAWQRPGSKPLAVAAHKGSNPARAHRRPSIHTVHARPVPGLLGDAVFRPRRQKFCIQKYTFCHLAAVWMNGYRKTKNPDPRPNLQLAAFRKQKAIEGFNASQAEKQIRIIEETETPGDDRCPKTKKTTRVETQAGNANLLGKPKDAVKAVDCSGVAGPRVPPAVRRAFLALGTVHDDDAGHAQDRPDPAAEPVRDQSRVAI